MLTGKKKLLVGGLGAAAVAIAVYFLYANRVELFVLPARWREILELEERARGKPWHEPESQRLGRALEKFLQLRGVQFQPEEKGVRFLEPIKAHEGTNQWLLVHMPEELYQHRIRLLLLDGWGRRVGDALPAAKVFGTEPWQHWIRVHKDEYPFDLIRVNGGEACSDHSVDRAGIVQRGLVLNGSTAMYSTERPLPVEVCVSSGISREVRHWLLADSRPLASHEAIELLLASPREPYLFRGLYEIERLGKAGARLARPLLRHESPDLRARAAAIVGNDPALGGELASLLEDPSEKVKRSALFSLLNSEDTGLARRALLDLIGKDLGFLSRRNIDFDLERLMSSEVVTAVLSSSLKSDYRLEYLERFLTCFRREHLQPVVSSLVLYLREVEARVLARGEQGAFSRDTLRILVWLLAGAETEESDSVLGEVLSRDRPVGEFLIDPADVLEALLHRRTPLRGSNPTTVLSRLPDSLWRQTLLLQVWWGVPGALEKLSERIRTAPDEGWTSSDIWTAPRVAVAGLFAKPRASDERPGAVLDSDVHAPWLSHTPPALLPLFIGLASQNPDAYLDIAADVLRSQEPETLRGLDKDIANLLEHTEPHLDLYRTAAKSGSRALDPWVMRALRGWPQEETSPEVLDTGWRDVILWDLLQYREAETGQELIGAVELVSRTENPTAAEPGQNPDEYRRERRAEWKTNVIEGPRWWLDVYWEDAIDVKLAANILLARWKVPGASEKLLAKLNEPGNDWIFDFLWEAFLPASLVPDLKDLAARGSPEVIDRVQYLLSTAAKRDSSPH